MNAEGLLIAVGLALVGWSMIKCRACWRMRQRWSPYCWRHWPPRRRGDGVL